MKRSSPKRRTKKLAPMSAKRREKLFADDALVPGSTFAVAPPAMRVPGKAKQSRPADTGPDRATVEAALDRAAHACERCGGGVFADRRGVDWSVHHRQRRSQGGTNTLDNLVVLCGGSEADGCHRWAHSEVATARAEGWLVDRDQDPRLKPIPHALHGFVYLAVDGSRSTRRPHLGAGVSA